MTHDHQKRGPRVGRTIFLIATEESGDRLGAGLMKVLRQRLGDAVQFSGVGGRAMTSEGLVSLFPIEELSIVGLAAVLRQVPEAVAVDRADRGCGHGRIRRYSRDHRQSGFYPSRCPTGSRPRSVDPDRRLRLAVGMGVAARACARDAQLCRSCAGAAAVRTGGLSQAQRAALQLCRPPADRAGRPAAAERGRAEQAAGAAADFAGAAGQPPQRDRASSGDLRRCAGPPAGARRELRAGASDHAASRERGARGRHALDDRPAHRDRRSGEARRISHRLWRARQVRHGDAGTGACGSADGHRLSPWSGRGLHPAAGDQGAVGDPGQSRHRPGGHSGISPAGLHGGEARRRACRTAGGLSVAPTPARGVRNARCDHVDRPSLAERARRRHRAGDDAEGATDQPRRRKSGRDGCRQDRIRPRPSPVTCGCPSRHSRGGSRRCRAGADGRSSAADPRSSRSTG